MKLSHFVTKSESDQERKPLGFTEFYESLFHHHPDFVYALDLKGNIMDVNQEFKRVLGYLSKQIRNS